MNHPPWLVGQGSNMAPSYWPGLNIDGSGEVRGHRLLQNLPHSCQQHFAAPHLPMWLLTTAAAELGSPAAQNTA